MNDAIQLFLVLLAVTAAGAVGFTAFTLVTALSRRLRAKDAAGLSSGEFDATRERLAETEALEARVTELEERLDFAERMLSQHHEPERLPGGHPLEPQH